MKTWKELFEQKRVKPMQEVLDSVEWMTAHLENVHPSQTKLIFHESDNGGLEWFDLGDPEFRGMTWTQIFKWLYDKFYDPDGAIYGLIIEKNGGNNLADFTWDLYMED